MMERIWSGASPFWRLLLPLSLLYGLGSTLIRLSYRIGLRTSWRAPLPVIVVGNLTAGGSGKTPLVIWLTEQLQQRGLRVGIVSRGYGGKAAHYPLMVSDHSQAVECGDEPLLIFLRTQAPLAVAPRRADAIRHLLTCCAVDLILTDDGLQHYALERDREIVVIDGLRRFGNGWWLPAGPLRERPARLRQVHAIITNGGTPHPGEIPMHLHAEQAVNLANGRQTPLTQLNDIVALAGIGHPARFFATLHQAGITPQRCIPLADHQTLSETVLHQLTRPGQQLLMTEKDAVKYRAIAAPHWWYLPVTARLPQHTGDQLIADLLSLVKK